MSIERELSIYLRARVPVIVLVTVEETRAVEILRWVQKDRDPRADMVSWDVAARFASANGATLSDVAMPGAALDKIAEMAESAPASKNLYVLKDFHEFWKQPEIKRKVRRLAQRLVFTGSSLIAITPTRDLPIELRDEAVVVELPLPDSASLRTEMDRLIQQTGIRCDLPGSGRERLAQAAVGLTANQARRAFSKAIVRDQVLDEQDIAAVLDEKKAVIRQNQALEFYSADETPDDIGGLEVLINWLALRERAFSQEAADFGLPAPKGIALIGIPGTGKSLTAKMIGGMWNLPLLRLDVGALFGSLVGESEERVREALRLAETVAPCVLWIDELEKSLSSGGLDGGTSQRVFGSILTWMQEKTKPVFIVATANDVAALPPEVLRRGRFDEIFFLDLPTEAERHQILKVHLRKRRRDPGQFDLMRLAQLSDGYVGAELEQAVIDAMYNAFGQSRDIATADIEASIRRMVPLSRSQREAIEGLRSWLRDGRAQSASFAEIAAAERSQVRLELA